MSSHQSYVISYNMQSPNYGRPEKEIETRWWGLTVRCSWGSDGWKGMDFAQFISRIFHFTSCESKLHFSRFARIIYCLPSGSNQHDRTLYTCGRFTVGLWNHLPLITEIITLDSLVRSAFSQENFLSLVPELPAFMIVEHLLHLLTGPCLCFATYIN